MPQRKVKFIKEKETKNTIMYREMPEDGEAPIINQLYIQKWVKPGDTVVVTLEWD